MFGFLVRRCMGAVLVLVLATVGTFLLGALVPGDPARMMLGPLATQDQIAAVRARWGLDEPLPVQFGVWVERMVVHGDFGRSPFYNMTNLELLSKVLPVTLELMLLSFVLSLAVSIALGLATARHRGSTFDRITMGIIMVVSAIPDFVLASILLLVFTVKLRLLPSANYVSFATDPAANLSRMVLPTISMMAFYIAQLTRYVRSASIEIGASTYIAAARARGLSERAVKYKHILRNALIPLLTIAGVHITYALGGVIVQETVFSLPGIGRLALAAILNRDFWVLRTIVLFTAVVAVVLSLVIDLAYGLIDPRIRYD